MAVVYPTSDLYVVVTRKTRFVEQMLIVLNVRECTSRLMLVPKQRGLLSTISGHHMKVACVLTCSYVFTDCKRVNPHRRIIPSETASATSSVAHGHHHFSQPYSLTLLVLIVPSQLVGESPALSANLPVEQ